jgi:Ca-activated chloride channel family protein
MSVIPRIPTACVVVLSVVLVALGLWGCDDAGSPTAPGSASPSGQAASKSKSKSKPDAGAIELVFPYGSEKKQWINAVTEAFNREQHRTPAGQTIVVKPIPMGSGETMQEVLEGRLQAHLVSPASAAFIKLYNAQAQTKNGKDLVGPTQDLVLSPVIIAMWKPMAQALGWPDRPVGWSDLIDLARNEKGWAAHGFPQWGKFKFGHTHPQYSNSGLIALFAEVYAATGKQAGLTLEDVAKPETGVFLREIERSVVHYGSSTGFFGHKLFANGPTYLSAAVLYENLVIESYDRAKYPNQPFPVVAIYPKEGTFWSDHPVGIVQREWVTPGHEAAAKVYIDYLLAAPQQSKAVNFGFRPSDPAIAIGAPIDAAHGVDPAQPKTTLEVPSVSVMDAIDQLWRRQKKHANLVLVIDTSGSMKESGKLESAKLGAKELINMLGDEDTLSIVAFSNTINTILPATAMASGRTQAVNAIDSLIASGGTALYDATFQSYQQLLQHPAPDRIEAVVVLTDGKDSGSNLKLNPLLSKLNFDSETRSVRVFLIGYGEGADHQVLEQIAEKTQAKSYQGKPENIREVFKEISTFF